MEVLRRSITVLLTRQVPAVCYAVCNNAYIEVQGEGKTPTLCATDSAFTKDYSACTVCIAQNANTNTSRSSYNDIAANFKEYLDYCASLAAASSSLNAAQQALLSSELGAASTLAGLISRYSDITSSKGSSATSIASPSPPTTPNPLPGQHTNRAWIAGAVLGPIFLVLIVAIIFFFFWQRKKRDRSSSAQMRSIQEDLQEKAEKPQLHAESLAPPRHELESERKTYIRSELPGTEPAVQELQGHSIRDTAPD